MDARLERLARRRWAMLIQRIYQVDPLVCPKCGATMKIISFVEARQNEVIRKILERCGLWHEPPPRAPPPAPSCAQAVRAERPSHSTESVEMDGDYLEHLRRESMTDQLELPWE